MQCPDGFFRLGNSMAIVPCDRIHPDTCSGSSNAHRRHRRPYLPHICGISNLSRGTWSLRSSVSSRVCHLAHVPLNAISHTNHDSVERCTGGTDEILYWTGQQRLTEHPDACRGGDTSGIGRGASRPGPARVCPTRLPYRSHVEGVQ